MTLETPLVRYHGGGWQDVRARGLLPRDFVDFSSNINPSAPPPGAREAILANLGDISSYPDPECRGLREALSGYLEVPPECVLAGNGASDLLFSLVRYLHPRRGAVPRPSFCEYEIALASVGAETKSIPLPEERSFIPDKAEALGAAYEADLTIVAAPNNPTGNLPFAGVREELLEAARAGGGFLLADEAFLDFHPRRSRLSLAREAASLSGLAVLGSLTKFFGLAGLRLGYLVARPELIRGLASSSSPWSVNALAQAAGVSALADRDFAERSRSETARERGALSEALSGIRGLKPFASCANFLLVRLPEGLRSRRLCEVLLEQRILVRDCASFAGLEGDFVRVAVKTREENRMLTGLLRDALR